MTTKTDYKPCPRSWGDGYTAGYRQAIRDAAEMLETADNRSILQMTALEQADQPCTHLLQAGRTVQKRPRAVRSTHGLCGHHSRPHFKGARMNTEQEHLLPCPFCGGHPKLTYKGREGIGPELDSIFKVECECGASIKSRHYAGFREVERKQEVVEKWNRRATLQESLDKSQNHLNRQGIVMDKLFCDLKTDEEKAAFFLSGRGYETGVIAQAIQNDVAMAYHRCVEYKKELEALQSQDREDAERYLRLRDGQIDDIAVVRGLGATDYGASVVIGTYEEEIDGDDLDEAIDLARRIEEKTE